MRDVASLIGRYLDAWFLEPPTQVSELRWHHLELGLEVRIGGPQRGLVNIDPKELNGDEVQVENLLRCRLLEVFKHQPQALLYLEGDSSLRRNLKEWFEKEIYERSACIALLMVFSSRTLRKHLRSTIDVD